MRLKPLRRPLTTSELPHGAVFEAGSHFRMSKWPEETWQQTELENEQCGGMSNVKWPEEFWVVHQAGEPLPDILAIRREAPEFWAMIEDLDFQSFSAFADDIEHHAKQAPCSLRGGLSKAVREKASLYNQIITEIEAKMTAALQVTYTTWHEQALKRELMRLAEHQLDVSYNVEEGNLNELNTWKLMAEKGEMTENALRECSLMPFMEFVEPEAVNSLFEKLSGGDRGVVGIW